MFENITFRQAHLPGDITLSCGDLVRLKGSPQVMNVYTIEPYGSWLRTEGYLVRCDWIASDGEPWSTVFDPLQLEKVEADKLGGGK